MVSGESEGSVWEKMGMEGTVIDLFIWNKATEYPINNGTKE